MAKAEPNQTAQENSYSKMNVSLSNQALMKRIVTLVSAWLILNTILLGDDQGKPAPIKAVINYSAAPWDDAAYEILVPMPKTGEASDLYIRIDIWVTPNLRSQQAYAFQSGRIAMRVVVPPFNLF